MRNAQHGWSRRAALAAALATLAPGAAPAAAPPLDFGTAIDGAGRQRMLTQRIVKAYCQIGLQVAPQASRAQLNDALARFAAHHAWISRRAPDAAVAAALKRVGTLWPAFRQAARAAVNRDGARALHQRDEALLAASHEVVLALEAAAATPQARLVNLSGRQRMLSQRLAKLYMLRAWGLQPPGLGEQVDAASREFAQALASLQQAPENTPQIAAELEAVAMQWDWFSSAIALQGAQSYTLVVADASETILKSMDLVTSLYAQLARR